MSLPKPYYEDEGATIYHGDCREILPHVEADVVVTDPPYGLDFPYMTYNDTRENLRRLIADAIVPVVERVGSAAILCGPTQIQLYPPADWVAAITWDTTGTFGKRGYNQWTPVLCYGPDLEGFGNVNGVTKSDTKKMTPGQARVGSLRTALESTHTCPKPLGTMNWIVTRFTPEGATILDPFMGSGTTLVAAKNLGRKSIGIEIEERYCEIAAERLSQGVLDFGGGAHD